MMLEKGRQIRRASGLCWLVAPLAWMAVIYWFSAQPNLPQAPDPLADLLLKKGAHVAEYAVLVVLWRRAICAITRTRVVSCAPTMVVAWGMTVLYAVADEYHQKSVLGRHGCLSDVAVDAAGASLAVLGLWISALVYNRRSRLRF